MRKLTQEEFVSYVKNNVKNVTVIGKYVGSNIGVECRCDICGNEWKPTLDSLRRGSGCPKCAIENRKNKLTLSHDVFISRMLNINPHIKINSEYKAAKEKVDCECLVCGHKWKATPLHLQSGRGCPKCANNHRNDNRKITKDVFYSRLKEANQDVEVLSEYKSYTEYINVRCNVCGNEWDVLPYNLLAGKRCFKCVHNHINDNRKITKEQFSQRIKEINGDISVVDYTDHNSHSLLLCRKCGHTFNVLPDSVYRYCECPYCKGSSGEKRIIRFLDSNNIDYEFQKRFDDLRGKAKKKLSYDFYIPSKNLLIEFQGRQHEEPVEYFGGEKPFDKQKTNDDIKKRYAIENNYDLLEIWHSEYKNIDEILTNKLIS